MICQSLVISVSRYRSRNLWKWETCTKLVENAVFWYTGLKCWVQFTAPPKKGVEILMQSNMDHQILARFPRPGCGCGQPLPRRVCACDAQRCREKRHVHCGPGTVSRSLRCVVCTSETAFFGTSTLARFLLLPFFFITFLDSVFLNFSTLPRVLLIFRL